MKENGRDSRIRSRRVVPYALILVLKEESHESDVARRSRSKRPSPNDRSSTGYRETAICKTAAGRLRAVLLASLGGREMPNRNPIRVPGALHRALAHD